MPLINAVWRVRAQIKSISGGSKLHCNGLMVVRKFTNVAVPGDWKTPAQLSVQTANKRVCDNIQRWGGCPNLLFTN
jgi:hypothetical protein